MIGKKSLLPCVTGRAATWKPRRASAGAPPGQWSGPWIRQVPETLTLNPIEFLMLVLTACSAGLLQLLNGCSTLLEEEERIPQPSNTIKVDRVLHIKG